MDGSLCLRVLGALLVVSCVLTSAMDTRKKPVACTHPRGWKSVEDWVALGSEALVRSCQFVHLPTSGADGIPFSAESMAQLLFDYWSNVVAEGRNLRHTAPLNYRELTTTQDEEDVEEDF